VVAPPAGIEPASET